MGGSSSSTNLRCGTGIGSYLGGGFVTETGSCRVSVTSRGSGDFVARQIQIGTKQVINQAIADKIQRLEDAAARADSESARDTDRGMGLTWKAIGIFGEYETTREEAAVAAGRAAEAAVYAAEERDRAAYLTEVCRR